MKIKYFFFILILSSCFAEKKEILNPVAEKKKRSSKKIELDQEAFDQGVASKASRDFAANEKRCVKALERMQPSLKQLVSYLPAHVSSETKQNPFYKMAKHTKSDCHSSEQSKVIETIFQSINNHNQKIAVFLPLSSQYAYLGESVLKGIKTASQVDQISFADTYTVLDTKGTKEGLIKAIASVLFNSPSQPSAMIGGVTEEEAGVLSALSRNILMPTLIVNQKADLIKDSEYAFQVYPASRHLAASLALAAKSKNIKKMTIFKPSDGKSSELIDFLQEELKKNQIEVSKIIGYHSGDYESMEAAVRDVSGTDPSLRQDEYALLYEKAKEKAKANKEIFQPNLVILSPKVETDGVLIPDNFRIVRHFTKIFQYHGVTSLPLMGHYEWRASHLISPWEKFLEQSFFVDYIGSYQNLPKELKPSNMISEYLVPQEEVIPIDFSFIGYRAGLIADFMVKEKNPKRYQIAQSLLNAEKSDPYFSKGRIFDEHRQAIWPTVVFNLSSSGFSVLARYDAF